MTADDIIAMLGLAPHPVGGWYRQTFASDAPGSDRPAATAIHFLLKEGEASHWHRVDADEMWFWHSGAPLVLSVSPDDLGPARALVLGPDLERQALQGFVPAGHWQAARTTGAWTLVSCAVAPGFRFDGFELAAPGFDIPPGP
ncbi:cupin domain-containing protein [Jannaschia ovalis]|uniref:Cupin domain-containing protein n=1 Tax=Jannaschia ovalis TaxID=3038773 RepID=A0ABY8LEH2_9RHOB|nr:cupin domain-containing protein [Jannaschia sp. GRR-S6-38]WGH78470.1 cupin domain-containing protein [Jannaschia sp. GRR-S6-38]